MRVRAGALALRLQLQHMPAPPRSDPWSELEWWEHPEAIRAVQAHPEGMTLEQIGRQMGVTRERVRQIEAVALRKLKECGGNEVIDVGRFAYAIPDCRVCGLPFVRRNGRDQACEGCKAARARKRRHH